MTRRFIRLACLAGLALLSTTLAVPAPAAPTWLTPPTPLSDPAHGSFGPQVVFDPSGTATAVWTTYTSGTHAAVWSSSRPPGGSWSAPVLVSSTGDAGTSSDNVDIGIDAAGDVTAIWSVGEYPGPFAVKASSRPAGGAWSAPATLATGLSFFPLPHVTVDPTGNATALWRNPTPAINLDTRYRPVGSDWGPVETLDTTTGLHALAAGPDGTVVAAWPATVGSDTVIRARVRAPGGGWTAPVTISAPGQAGIPEEPDVAASGNGGFVVAWGRQVAPNSYIVQAATRNSAGTWSSSADLAAPGAQQPRVQVATDPAGNAAAVWIRYDGTSFHLYSGHLPAGGVWSPDGDISGPFQQMAAPAVVMDGLGTSRAAWIGNPGAPSTHWQFHTAAHPAGATWSSPVGLSNPQVDVTDGAIAVDPLGNALVAFPESPAPSQGVVKAVGLDGAGPTITGFIVPVSAQQGAPLGFAASATDGWSEVTSYSWSFGDGTAASGASVAHAYAAAGTFTVTLTVSDAVGNTTTRTATTTVPTPVPVIGTFQLTKPKIQALSRAVAKKTKLKVGLNTAATLKLVIKSKHRHLIKGRKKFLKVVLRKQLPAGLSKITIKARLKGIRLKPDTYVITGLATNVTGHSTKKKTKLKVTRP